MAAPTTYYSLLQWRMEERRLLANTHFKSGNLAAAVDVYLSAATLFEEHNAKPNNEALLASSSASSPSQTDAASSSSSLEQQQQQQPPSNMVTTASPATIRVSLLEELIKSVGNACTSLYKLGRYAECATVAKRKGIDKNPYFAKGHAFVGMSNMNLLAVELKKFIADDGALKQQDGHAALTSDERVFAAQRLHEAIQRLFTSMLLLPAMAPQVKASLLEGLELLRVVQQESGEGEQGGGEADSAEAPPPTEALIGITKSTDGHGHGVVAKKALPAGTLLARLSHPFSVAPYDGYHKHVCIACGVPIADDDDESSSAQPKAEQQQKSKKKDLGCTACRRVRYCSEACQNRYHVPRHLLHECAYMLKLKVMGENIVERDLDVPDEFAELATHTITTLSGLLVLKSAPLAFFDPTNKALAEALQNETDNANKKQTSGDDACDNKKEKDSYQGGNTESFLDKAYKIRKSLLALESHSVEVAQSMHPTLPLLCEVFGIQTMGDRGAVSSLSAPPSTSASLPELDEHLVATLIGIVRCNSMEISDPSGLGVGQGLFAVPNAYLGLFPSSSSSPPQHFIPSATTAAPEAIALSPCHFNHSCDPNAAFDVKAQEIRTIASIPAGADVTISYIPQLYWPATLRSEGLAERFYFNCTCDRCAPYRREARRKEAEKAKATAKSSASLGQSKSAAAAASSSDNGSAAPPSVSPLMRLLTVTAEDAEVSAVYDKISSAEKPIAATERPGATRYYYNNMLGVCGGIRQRPVEEILAAEVKKEAEGADGTTVVRTTVHNAGGGSGDNAFVGEVKALERQCAQHLEPWHYVCHDIHNTLTFLYSVLGDHRSALVSSLEELLTFEACVAGSVPAKADKIANIKACREGLRAAYEEAVAVAAAAAGSGAAPTAAGFEAYLLEKAFGAAECRSAYKEVLALLCANDGQLLDLLAATHSKRLH